MMPMTFQSDIETAFVRKFTKEVNCRSQVAIFYWNVEDFTQCL